MILGFWPTKQNQFHFQKERKKGISTKDGAYKECIECETNKQESKTKSQGDERETENFGLHEYFWVMDKPNFPEKQTITTWGTWEELLLACAVHRYGTHCWDSVAAEIRKRSSNLHHLTPQTCKRKFHDLRRRFNHQNDVVCDDAASPIPWLDQLRQLRLDELRRDVQRYDLSIV